MQKQEPFMYRKVWEVTSSLKAQRRAGQEKNLTFVFYRKNTSDTSVRWHDSYDQQRSMLLIKIKWKTAYCLKKEITNKSTTYKTYWIFLKN